MGFQGTHLRRSHADADADSHGHTDTNAHGHTDTDAHANTIRATRNAGNDNSNASGREPNRFLERG